MGFSLSDLNPIKAVESALSHTGDILEDLGSGLVNELEDVGREVGRYYESYGNELERFGSSVGDELERLSKRGAIPESKERAKKRVREAAARAEVQQAAIREELLNGPTRAANLARAARRSRVTSSLVTNSGGSQGLGGGGNSRVSTLGTSLGGGR